MAEQGKVAWYNEERGFGFITPNLGGKDIFLHSVALKKAGIEAIQQGDIVSFEIETRDGKSRAGSLELIASAAGASSR